MKSFYAKLFIIFIFGFAASENNRLYLRESPIFINFKLDREVKLA